ncbi:hypothetical protein QBC47DRAFT_169933 [Echria macrotheca]|uniref:Uncharacterized protein n=1 Tax=Echria macrotheca TaxID=438768 RepID=A0AAJ0BJ47_9PEZI|nr:hypothetical protein QBC47DRAFT_169933 [Echria macrotheca]
MSQRTLGHGRKKRQHFNTEFSMLGHPSTSFNQLDKHIRLIIGPPPPGFDFFPFDTTTVLPCRLCCLATTNLDGSLLLPPFHRKTLATSTGTTTPASSLLFSYLFLPTFFPTLSSSSFIFFSFFIWIPKKSKSSKIPHTQTFGQEGDKKKGQAHARKYPSLVFSFSSHFLFGTLAHTLHSSHFIRTYFTHTHQTTPQKVCLFSVQPFPFNLLLFFLLLKLYHIRCIYIYPSLPLFHHHTCFFPPTKLESATGSLAQKKGGWLHAWSYTYFTVVFGFRFLVLGITYLRGRSGERKNHVYMGQIVVRGVAFLLFFAAWCSFIKKGRYIRYIYTQEAHTQKMERAAFFFINIPYD